MVFFLRKLPIIYCIIVAITTKTQGLYGQNKPNFNDQNEWETIFSTTEENIKLKILLALVIKTLGVSNNNPFPIITDIAKITSIEEIIYILEINEQFMKITKAEENLLNHKNNLDNIIATLLDNEDIQEFMEENKIPNHVMSNLVKKMYITQTVHYSAALTFANYLSGHIYDMNTIDKKNQFITKSICYKFILDNNQKLPLELYSINRQIIGALIPNLINKLRRISRYTISDGAITGENQELNSGDYIIKNKKMNNKKIREVIICENSCNQKVKDKNVTFMVVKLKCSSHIKDYDIETLLNKLDSVPIINTLNELEKILNEYPDLIAVNYSHQQTTSIYNLRENRILNLIYRFPKEKYIILESKISLKNISKYRILVILDVRDSNNEIDSIKDPSVIDSIVADLGKKSLLNMPNHR